MYGRWPAGHLDCVNILLDARCSLTADCDGCPPLHMAVCTGAVTQSRAKTLQLVRLMIKHGADTLERQVVRVKALSYL